MTNRRSLDSRVTGLSTLLLSILLFVPALANSDQLESEPPGEFGPQNLISDNATNARAVYAADLNGDGSIDVLSASSGRIAWYENLADSGLFGTARLIDGAAHDFRSVFAVDLDGDGDRDVLSGSFDDSVYWYENTDGLGSFGTARMASARGSDSVVAADLDGDGDLDTLTADFGVYWTRNIDGAGTFGAPQPISSELSADRIFVTDLDGDLDNDLLSLGPFGVSWTENLDGNGNFGTLQTIADGVFSDSSIVAADLDGDLDNDVLSGRNGAVVWYENSDGLGSFGAEQVISTSGTGNGVFAADLDGDGDLDALSASYALGETIAWHENLDGLGSFGPRRTIAGDVGGGVAVFAADLSGDGILDTLSANYLRHTIAWYENASDGVEDAFDNCPFTSNANQTDADDDGSGDACDDCTDPDLDGFGDPGLPATTCPLDNCPLIANPDQTDGDLDDSGLACDCDDTNPAMHPGGSELNDGLDNDCNGLTDETASDSGFSNPNDRNEYSWSAQPGALKYQVVRAESSDLSLGCTLFTILTPLLVDPAQPAAGEGFYYLNRAAQPFAGSWGRDSSNVERHVPCD